MQPSNAYKWLIGILCLAIVAVAVLNGAKVINFQPNLTQKAVDLAATLSVVVVLVERFLAVINNIWFGTEQEKKETEVRTLKTTEGIVRNDLNRAEAARETMASLSASGALSPSAAPAITTMSSEIDGLRGRSQELTASIMEAQQTLTETEAKQSQLRLQLGYLFAVLISAIGVRALEALIVPNQLTGFQGYAFQAADILLTAGLIAGGSSGLSSISQLFGSYLAAARARAQG